jgi:hypothetical protein
MSVIRYPMMRLEIAVAVTRLGDPEYQRRAWVDQQFPPGKRHLGVQEVAEWLAENMIALEDPAELVGAMLHEDEVPLLRHLAEVFLPMFDEHGYTDDAVYLQDDRWPTVVERAAAASALINANGGFPMPPSGMV